MNKDKSFVPLPRRKRPVTAESSSQLHSTTHFVIIGGGIAGVSVAKELSRLASSASNSFGITIINPQGYLKEAKVVMQVSKYLEELDIFEKTSETFCLANPDINIIEDVVESVNYISKSILLAGMLVC